MRKIPVLFLPFLNPKNIIPNYIIVARILLCSFCGFEPCPRTFLVVRLGVYLSLVESIGYLGFPLRKG